MSFKNDAILIFQRFNTAITRAKHMLIVIGDPYLLSRDSTWNEYVYYLRLTYLNTITIFFRFFYYLWQHYCFNINAQDEETWNYWHHHFSKMDSIE